MPGDRDAEIKHLGRSKFFTLWAEERALSAGVDGVYVLICTAPRHVEVHVTDRFQQVFDKGIQAKLHRIFAGKNDRNIPQAVNEAIAVMQDQLEVEARRREAARSDARSSGWAWAVWAMLGILGVWLLLALIRRFSNGKTVAPPNVVSSGALAGQSMYQAMVRPPSSPRENGPTAPVNQPAVATLPYPAPAPAEPQT